MNLDLLEANVHYKNGHSLFWSENKYDEAILEYKKCIIVRESLLGRYHDNTADAYGWIGECYYNMNEYSDAIEVYRPYHRIMKYISYNKKNMNGKNNTNKKFPDIRDSLKKCGLTKKQIKRYHSTLDSSTKHEKDGDTYRFNGNYKKALDEYQKAINIEKVCIGSSITLAFLWRKIACITAIQVSNNIDKSKIDWNQLDCIIISDLSSKCSSSSSNNHQLQHLNVVETFESIRLGDIQHRKFEYKLALDQYQNAVITIAAMKSSIININSHDSMEHVEVSLMQVDIIEHNGNKINEIQQDIVVHSPSDDKIHGNRVLMEKIDNSIGETKINSDIKVMMIDNDDGKQQCINNDINNNCDVIEIIMNKEMEKLQQYNMEHYNNLTKKFDDLKTTMVNKFETQQNVISDHVRKTMNENQQQQQHNNVSVVQLDDKFENDLMDKIDKKIKQMKSSNHDNDDLDQFNNNNNNNNNNNVQKYQNIIQKDNDENNNNNNTIIIDNVNEKIREIQRDSIERFNETSKNIQDLKKSMVEVLTIHREEILQHINVVNNNNNGKQIFQKEKDDPFLLLQCEDQIQHNNNNNKERINNKVSSSSSSSIGQIRKLELMEQVNIHHINDLKLSIHEISTYQRSLREQLNKIEYNTNYHTIEQIKVLISQAFHDHYYYYSERQQQYNNNIKITNTEHVDKNDLTKNKNKALMGDNSDESTIISEEKQSLYSDNNTTNNNVFSSDVVIRTQKLNQKANNRTTYCQIRINVLIILFAFGIGILSTKTFGSTADSSLYDDNETNNGKFYYSNNSRVDEPQVVITKNDTDDNFRNQKGDVVRNNDRDVDKVQKEMDTSWREVLMWSML